MSIHNSRPRRKHRRKQLRNNQECLLICLVSNPRPSRQHLLAHLICSALMVSATTADSLLRNVSVCLSNKIQNCIHCLCRLFNPITHFFRPLFLSLSLSFTSTFLHLFVFLLYKIQFSLLFYSCKESLKRLLHPHIHPSTHLSRYTCFALSYPTLPNFLSSFPLPIFINFLSHHNFCKIV